MKRTIVIILLLLNVLVLMGQLWPEGVPPFAPVVNIVFLTGSMLYFIKVLFNKRKPS